MSTKKIVGIFSITGLVIVAGIYLFGDADSDGAYKLDTVRRGNLEVKVTSTGTVKGLNETLVSTQASGKVSKVFADYNEKVRKGQVLAEVDPTFLQAGLLEAEANLQKAKTQLNQHMKNYTRLKQLDETLISKLEKEESLINYELAEASYRQALAKYNTAKVSLASTRITSPIDGVILSRKVDVGQTVAVSPQSPPLFVIVEDLASIRVQAYIDEADIGKIRVGQSAHFFVDAFPEENFIGEVEQVRIEPKVANNIVSYEIIIQAKNRDGQLLPGMTANLSIIVETKTDVTLVPNLALGFQPALSQGQYKEFIEKYGKNFDLKNKSMIWIVDEQNKIQPLFVNPGISDGFLTEITDSTLAVNTSIIIGKLSRSNGSGGYDFAKKK